MATTPSQFSELGLAIVVSDPLIKSSRSALSENLTAKITSYSQELRRVGGYFTAKISLNEPEERINYWIQNGLGRHVEVYNPSGVMIWEGFVNDIDVAMGEDRFGIGPLTDVANRVSVTYSVIDTSTDPPTLGVRATTATADNSVSTGLYGIWHKIEAINGALAADATQLRDMFLNDPTRAFPATSGDVSYSGGSAYSITLSLCGYWFWLKSYYYTNAATGTINLSTKITDTLGADPNGIFSTDYTKITTNTTQVADSASGGQTAETILKDLNSRGDAANNPYSMGFYAGRRFWYVAIPTDIEYQKRRGKPVTDRLGGVVRPWDVNPAEWIFRPDFLVGRHPPITEDTLGTDPRAGLIETVKYSTPYGLSVNGRKLSNLDQALAKRGMGGMD